MNRRLASLAIAALFVVPLAGCVASQIPDVYQGQGPITVPESLKPTSVPEEMEPTDAACATSWVTYERAIDAYDAAMAKIPGSYEARDGAFGDDATENVDILEKVGKLTIARGETILTAADQINHSVLEKLLTGIGNGEIADGEYLVAIESATDADIDAAITAYDETTALINQYAATCGVVIGGSTGA